jgi:hypothetical protein
MKIIQKSVFLAFAAASSLTAQEMNMEWGERVLKLEPANAERGQLFNDGNYAMFIHWGLFSQLANRYEGKTYYGIGEWLMNRRMANIPVEEYKKIPAQFNPTQFDPQAIAQLAKDAGMKYVVITAKHHDGFAMYDSAVSDFDIVDQTPYGKDPMRALADACRALGLGFGFYYYVVYGTDASPWGNPLPWGDVTVKDNRLFLSVFDLPGDRTLNLPGLTNDVRSAKLIDGADRIPLQLTRENGWTRITLPLSMQETLVPVVEVVLEGSPKLADGWLALYDSAQSTEAKLMGIDPSIETTLLADFAKVHDAKKSKSGWMEKFGEWKHVVQVADFGDEGRATWEIDVLEPGHYQVDLTYRGPGRIIWRVEVGGGAAIQNEQNASHNYQRFPMGWVHFPEAGRHTLHVSAVDDSGRPKQIRGDEPRSLKAAHLKRIEF